MEFQSVPTLWFRSKIIIFTIIIQEDPQLVNGPPPPAAEERAQARRRQPVRRRYPDQKDDVAAVGLVTRAVEESALYAAWRTRGGHEDYRRILSAPAFCRIRPMRPLGRIIPISLRRFCRFSLMSRAGSDVDGIPAHPTLPTYVTTQRITQCPRTASLREQTR